MCKRHPINCIIPSHILEAMLSSSDPDIRNSAKNTIAMTQSLTIARAFHAESGVNYVSMASNGPNRTIYSNRGQLVRARSEGQGPVSDKSVNEAYDGLGNTYKFYKEVFNRNSIDAGGMPLTAIVHYGNRFNNAFWDGSKMVFGDGDGIIFTGFTKSLDVIAHELTHGVTQFANGLEYVTQSGALNESISDAFGSMVKQHTLQQSVDKADWLIGNDIIGPTIHGTALRSMQNPGTAYNDPRLGGKDPQPDHMSKYNNLPPNEANDMGGVHINSGIPNKAFYLAAMEAGGFAWDVIGPIWYNAMHVIPANCDFVQFAKTTISKAAEIYGTGSIPHSAVVSAWDTVGVAKAPSVPQGPTDQGNTNSSADIDSIITEVQDTISKLSGVVANLQKLKK